MSLKESGVNARLALYTFGIFSAPSDDPINDGFHKRNDPILAAVDHAPGFVARSGYAGEPGPEPWGDEVYPRFYSERGDGWSPATLSIWIDLESAMAFAYFGVHAEALTHGREWFLQPQWPPYVAWWISGGHVPTWADAVVRHEHLHDRGSSAFAFNFKSPFDAEGRGSTIDRDRMKSIAAASNLPAGPVGRS